MDKLIREEIRRAYKQYGPHIEAGHRLSPYDLGVDWMGLMSPIEDQVWSAIRYLGLPLYPQYPVKHYFLDFGDPEHHIGVEVDSIKWHKDGAKDWKREKEIRQEGWHIERIPSRFVYKDGDDFLYENEKEQLVWKPEYFYECAEGILRKLYCDIGFKKKMYCYIGGVKS